MEANPFNDDDLKKLENLAGHTIDKPQASATPISDEDKIPKIWPPKKVSQHRKVLDIAGKSDARWEEPIDVNETPEQKHTRELRESVSYGITHRQGIKWTPETIRTLLSLDEGPNTDHYPSKLEPEL